MRTFKVFGRRIEVVVGTVAEMTVECWMIIKYQGKSGVPSLPDTAESKVGKQ